jgi:hypothetical protein
MATITRSLGTIPRVCGTPVPVFPLPGGGYEGITDQLDRAVARAARFLARLTGKDITIRFNSDRRSGGAWLVDKARDDCSVMIGAYILAPRYIRRKWKRLSAAGAYVRIDDLWKPRPDSRIQWDVQVHRDFLLDPSLAGNKGIPKDRALWTAASALAAYAIFKRHADLTRIKGEL